MSRGGGAAPGGDVSCHHGQGGGEAAGAAGGPGQCQQRRIQILRVHTKVTVLILLNQWNILTGWKTEFQITKTLTQAGNDNSCTNMMWKVVIIPTLVGVCYIFRG